MNKAFIFDWSGTLSNNIHCFQKVCDIIFEMYGKHTITRQELRENFTLPYMLFWNKYIPEMSVERQKELYLKYIHEVGEPELFPRVKEIITYLHSKGYLLYVLSSDPPCKHALELKHSGLARCFSKVISGVYIKTDSIVSLIDEFNLSKKYTYYVGDTSGDIEAGKQAGIKTVGITWGFQEKKKLAQAKPDFLIDDISEIVALLDL